MQLVIEQYFENEQTQTIDIPKQCLQRRYALDGWYEMVVSLLYFIL